MITANALETMPLAAPPEHRHQHQQEIARNQRRFAAGLLHALGTKACRTNCRGVAAQLEAKQDAPRLERSARSELPLALATATTKPARMSNLSERASLGSPNQDIPPIVCVQLE